jgi:hypothetical protein
VQIKKYLSDCTERWRGGAKSGSTILSNTYFFENLASKRDTRDRRTPRWEMAGKTKEKQTPKRGLRRQAGFIDGRPQKICRWRWQFGGVGMARKKEEALWR